MIGINKEKRSLGPTTKSSRKIKSSDIFKGLKNRLEDNAFLVYELAQLLLNDDNRTRELTQIINNTPHLTRYSSSFHYNYNYDPSVKLDYNFYHNTKLNNNIWINSSKGLMWIE